MRRYMYADDTTFMQRALALARQGLGRTAPNPPVGAVIVKNGRVIGSGFHPAAGQPHAEIFALRACVEDPRGADLYVTLEPCCHYGKTPPCTKAIIEAGLKRVVIATLDPNPVVAGKGRQELMASGIEVVSGVCEDEAQGLLRWYSHWTGNKRPFVMVKAATTLDGKIAAAGGDSKWISSEASRLKVHTWRNEFDAVLVGIGTVLKDDPLLTCRIEGGRDPLRVIIDQGLQIPAQALCLGERCLVFTAVKPDKRPDLAASGTRIVHLDEAAKGELDWAAILEHLGKLGLHALMVEGGGGVYSSLLKTNLVDELRIFLAPKLLGGGIPMIDWGKPQRIDQALGLILDQVEMIGGDVLITAHREE